MELPETRSSDAEAVAAAVAATTAALADPAVDVVYQAVFATDEFVGFADFLVRDAAAGAPEPWVVQDTKLARHARVTALMQLAAYVDQLDRLGVPHSDRVELLLGDGSTSVHAVRDLMPVFRLRRERLRALVADRWLVLGTDVGDAYRQRLGLRADQVRVLHNPVAVPASVPERPGDEPVLAVAFGRLGHRKGSYDIVTALGTLGADTRAGLSVLLAGDGEIIATIYKERVATRGYGTGAWGWQTAYRETVQV